MIIGWLIYYLSQGKIFLEDLSSSIEIDVSEATKAEGIYTEGCFVLAEGVLDGDIFNVKVCSSGCITHRHSKTLIDTHRHSQTLTDTHRHSQTRMAYSCVHL